MVGGNPVARAHIGVAVNRAAGATLPSRWRPKLTSETKGRLGLPAALSE